MYNYRPQVICVTHCHSDHAALLPQLLRGTDPMVAYVPEEHSGLFQQYNLSSLQLKRGTTSVDAIHAVEGVCAGDERDLDSNHFLRVYALDHSVPTRGYGVFERRTKLRPEYLHLTKMELQSRTDREELFHQISVPQLVYLCDTSAKVFEQTELFAFPVIIVECTFWKAEDYARAQATKHIHWSDLEPLITAHPLTQFILIHFSERDNVDELKANIVKPDNCIFWQA